jgi:hypothetical protein
MIVLENLVYSRLWHGKLKEDSDEPNHDKRPGRPHHGQVTKLADHS